MLSSHNQNEMLKKQAPKHQRFTIKKLSVGVASVLIGLTFMGVNSASADDSAQSAAANQPVVVNTDNSNQATIPTTSNQPANEKATTTTHVTEAPAAAAATSRSAAQANAAVAPQADNHSNPTTESKTPQYYNVTVNYHDVTRGGSIQVLNRSKGKYEYKDSYKATAWPDQRLIGLFKAPVAGYQLLNPEVLDQYFDFDQNGYPTIKKDYPEQNINITLNYAVLSPIKVEYVDTDNGHVLASMVLPSYYMTPESPAHQAGDEKAPDASRYEGAAIDIPGYQLVSTPVLSGQIDGQVQNSSTDPNYIHLTFKYKKVMTNAEATTTTPGKDSSGAVIVNQWSSLPGTFTVRGVYGLKNSEDGNGDVEQRTQNLIDHYKQQGFSYIGTTNKLLNDDYYNYYATGTYLYLVPNKPVTVRYVDTQGNELAASDTIAANAANPDQTNQGINHDQYWYPAGEWSASPKKITGYHLVKTEGATNGNFTAYQYITTFVYAKDQGNVVVAVHDVTDNKDLDNYKYDTGTQDVGEAVNYNKANTIAELQKAGYKVLNADVVVPDSIAIGTQTVVINVAHDMVTVTPDKPANPNEPVNPSVPDGPKFPAGTYADQLNHTYVRTINYLDANTNAPVAAAKVQTVHARRTALVDKVTGQLKGYLDAQGNLVDGDGWTTDYDSWAAVDSPAIDGYQAPDKAEVAAVRINPNAPSSSQVENVYYTPEIIDPNTPTPDQPTDPTTPTNPGTPTTPTTPDNPGTPSTPVAPTNPGTPQEAAVVPGNGQPGQPAGVAVPGQTRQQGAPEKTNGDIQQQLPQTGNNSEQAAALGLGMGAIASLFGLLGLNKKREN